MKTFQRSLSALVALAAALCAVTADAGPLYRIESAQTIKSQNTPNWDYLAFDDAHSMLYISRREDTLLTLSRR